MSWHAIFLDGPLVGKDNDRIFMGALPRELYLMPHRGNWILVGTDGFPPQEPWPDQVRYVRNDARSQILPDIPPGEDEGWAAFEVVQ